jgi:hypothetical protein
MKPNQILTLTALSIFMLGSQPGSAADEPSQPKVPSVDPQAVAILNRAVDHLANAKQFSVSTEVWGDIDLEEGVQAQFTKILDIRLRRPDQVQLNVRTTVPKRSFYYDGKNFTLIDQQKGFYGTTAAPATIDETIEKMENDYGVEFPISDILISRPFGDGAKNAKTGQYLGVEPVLGFACHHVAFQNDEVEWQAWIDEGPVPLLRKAVIKSKEGDSSQQVIGIFSKWDFGTELPDFVFAFDPPPGSAKIDLVPTPDTSAETQTSK